MIWAFVAVLLLAKASQIYSFRAKPSPRPVRRTQVIKDCIALRGDIDQNRLLGNFFSAQIRLTFWLGLKPYHNSRLSAPAQFPDSRTGQSHRGINDFQKRNPLCLVAVEKP